MHSLYIGTYTKRGSKGIYFGHFDEITGRFTDLRLAAPAVNPSFLAVHPSRRFLYAVSELEIYNKMESGSIRAFAIDLNTGGLRLLNEVASRGALPCHLVVDASGQNAIVANYGGGNVSVMRIGENGHLAEGSTIVQHFGSSVHPVRQQRPHAHCITMSPDNRFVLVVDFGLDQVLLYRFDANQGSLDLNKPQVTKMKPGAGPRHLVFHPDGRYAYVINELQSTVTTFAYDYSCGALSELQTLSTLPHEFRGDSTASEVQVDPSGKFLYGSNRGHDSIAVFSINSTRGTLTASGHISTQGKTPRHFEIDPTGAFLLAANQDSDCVVAFRIDQKSGDLIPIGQMSEVFSPAYIKFVALK